MNDLICDILFLLALITILVVLLLNTVKKLDIKIERKK